MKFSPLGLSHKYLCSSSKIDLIRQGFTLKFHQENFPLFLLVFMEMLTQYNFTKLKFHMELKRILATILCSAKEKFHWPTKFYEQFLLRFQFSRFDTFKNQKQSVNIHFHFLKQTEHPNLSIQRFSNLFPVLNSFIYQENVLTYPSSTFTYMKPSAFMISFYIS